MDLPNENFYDDISSLVSPVPDYHLGELDEIIRSTDSHLDASLDLSAFSEFSDISTCNSSKLQTDTLAKALAESGITAWDDDYKLQLTETKPSIDEFQFNFSAFPSPATSHSHCTPPYNVSMRTESISSLDCDFNPDDFLNFLNDDDIKMENIEMHNNRNTPSPTGSCTSSSGSSTSGVQSDASSMTSAGEMVSVKNNIEVKQEEVDIKEFSGHVGDEEFMAIDECLTSMEEIKTKPIKNDFMASVPMANNVVDIAAQALPIINVLPVHAIPATPMKTSTPLKLPNNDATEKVVLNTKPLKVITNTRPIQSTSSSSSVSVSPINKLTPPPNSKPKTVYLSSNDFKVLMQKMNNNGQKKLTGPNGQMPKVIVKTASGKVITGNKSLTQTTTNSMNHPTQLKANIVKTNANAILFKPPPQADKLLSNNNRTEFGQGNRVDKNGVVDEKLLKKQQRMLKNRESASLSRRKKKEYMERLERRISSLEKENYTLKSENSSLRSQLMAFAQTCQCKNGKMSEFILKSLDPNNKANCSVLSAIDAAAFLIDNNSKINTVNAAVPPTATASIQHHIKIAPKPPNAPANINKNFRTRLSAAAVKKNVAVLFAMAFMVTLNVGNFQNYLNKSVLDNGVALEAAITGEDSAKPVVATGRHLLWVPTEQEFHENNNRSKRSIELNNMPPPPLHFLRPTNRTAHRKINEASVKDEPPSPKATKCGSSNSLGNVTKYMQENMRLARDLHKWIDGNDYLNLSMGHDMDQVEHLQFNVDYANFHLPLQGAVDNRKPGKRKLFMGGGEIDRKQAKLKAHQAVNSSNSLDLFKPRINEEYLRLFKGIKRQEDTFYVLSFNMDHILLPASAYNKSARPKMSLMLPAGDPSLNGDVVLMQIDCEVLNTTELELKSHMIPEKLRRQQRYENVKVKSNQVVNNHQNHSEDTNNATVKSSETFYTKPSSRSAPFMMDVNKNETITHKVTRSPLPISMNAKRKPVVKFNASSESILGSGVLNVRNSMLFSKMRETVATATHTHNSVTVKSNF